MPEAVITAEGLFKHDVAYNPESGATLTFLRISAYGAGLTPIADHARTHARKALFWPG
jgi:hypothetical protein